MTQAQGISGVTESPLTIDDLGAIAQALEPADAVEILRWAVERYGRRLTFSTGFGPEGCALIDMIARHDVPIDLFTLDTGLLFPETRELWSELQDRYGVTIRGGRPIQTVQEQAATHGDKLWERSPDSCCKLRKVFPLRAQLARVDAWVTAIRREQTPQRANAMTVEWDEKFAIAKVNPLVRWTKTDVWSYLDAHGVPYNRLHDRDYPSIGCTHCTTAVSDGEDERAGRWRGISKTECGLHGPAVPVTLQPAI